MIRRATANDASQLLMLMQKLAEFEGYADRFAVTESALIDYGLSAQHSPKFLAWVIDHDHALLGYAVVHIVPFTFDLRPTVVLKELFVEQHCRGRRYGSKLLATIVQFSQSIHARLLRWQVLPGNNRAKFFYCIHGGERDSCWENWVLDLDAAR